MIMKTRLKAPMMFQLFSFFLILILDGLINGAMDNKVVLYAF